LVETLNIPTTNIVISGDSAGGHTAIALLRYLEEHGSEVGLRMPAACWLWSPWIQPHANEDIILANSNYDTDYISARLMKWAVIAYSGLRGKQILESKYVSLLHHPFGTKTPIYVCTGGREVLFFDIKKWAQNMKNIDGNVVTIEIEENAPHDHLVLLNLGFNEAAKRSAWKCGEWTKYANPAWRYAFVS
jgi:acetyl esterase/lipase